MSLAIGGQLSRCWQAFREGGVIIAASVCDGWFNDNWFPSYRKTYDALQKYCTPAEFLESEDAACLAADTEYCFRYSNFFTYHPFHAMSMIAGGSVPALRTSAVIMPGTRGAQICPGNGIRSSQQLRRSHAKSSKIFRQKPAHPLHARVLLRRNAGPFCTAKNENVGRFHRNFR